MSNIVKEKSRVEKFLASLKGSVGITKERGYWEYVYESTDTRTPCMYEDEVIDEALVSGKAEKRALEIRSGIQLEHTIEIVALKGR